jgi:hypothetical protein
MSMANARATGWPEKSAKGFQTVNFYRYFPF